ncbi:MAG: hypothetical protein IIW96_07600 [Oscillibacter sp.]|nr:hypothetical protein [Oscillibacter sp.]
MERLTFEGNFCDIAMCDAEPDICGICDQRKVWERLKAYEDTGLEPEDFKKAFNEGALLKLTAQHLGTTPDRLREWAQTDKEDRLVALPCKVGDTVYQIRNKKHARGLGVSPRIVSSACVWTDGSYALCHQGMTYCQSRDLGKTWFLTQGEAEEALRRLEDA